MADYFGVQYDCGRGEVNNFQRRSQVTLCHQMVMSTSTPLVGCLPKKGLLRGGGVMGTAEPSSHTLACV